MPTHPHITANEQFFAAYAAQDVGGVRQLMAPDVIWFIPGHHPLAGTIAEYLLLAFHNHIIAR